MTASEHLEDIIARRRANTGESYEVARKTILERMAVLRAEADRSQGWVADWIREIEDGPCGNEGLGEIARMMGWIQHLARTPWKRELVLKFPPSCVVRAAAGWTHQIPADGTCGVVLGFSRNAIGATFVDVAVAPDSGYYGQCPPESLVIVGYHDGWTPDRVKKVIDEMDGPR